jgi:hypothetical protein
MLTRDTSDMLGTSLLALLQCSRAAFSFDPTADFGQRIMRFALTRNGKVPKAV